MRSAWFRAIVNLTGTFPFYKKYREPILKLFTDNAFPFAFFNK